MKDSNHRPTDKRIFSAAIVSVVLMCLQSAMSHAQTPARPELVAPPDVTAAFVYWTNYDNGSVGRARTTGTGANERFIATITGGTLGGGGLTANAQYLYWTGANGGTATSIARANLDGSGVDKEFITGAQNPCGVAVSSAYIYWGGDAGNSIGRAALDGTHVNQAFIETGGGVCGVAVTATHIYWANYRTGQIGRASISGSGVNSSFISSGSGSGVAIKGNYIYFTNGAGTAIGRATLSGTDVNPNFIENLNGEVAFLAVDTDYIFWADWGSNGSGTTIGRAKIDGTGVNQSFIKGAKGAFGIAVTGGDP